MYYTPPNRKESEKNGSTLSKLMSMGTSGKSEQSAPEIDEAALLKLKNFLGKHASPKSSPCVPRSPCIQGDSGASGHDDPKAFKRVSFSDPIHEETTFVRDATDPNDNFSLIDHLALQDGRQSSAETVPLDASFSKECHEIGSLTIKQKRNVQVSVSWVLSPVDFWVCLNGVENERYEEAKEAAQPQLNE